MADAAPRPSADPPKPESMGRRVLGIAVSLVGAGIGIAAVKIFGMMLFWPAALIGITWFILAKTKVEPVAVPMLAIMIGHTGWMLVGNAYLYAMNRLTADNLLDLLDVAVVLALAVWFLITRSRGPAIGVLIYQCLALASGVALSGDVSLPGLNAQALNVAQWLHYLLRAAGIACAIYAIARLGKKPPPEVAPASV